MRNIVILAIGDKYYGNWAHNLAISLKYHKCDSPILLIFDDKATKHFKSNHWKVFDNRKKIKTDHAWKDRRLEPGQAKLHIYEYLDVEENIFIDADSLCIKNPDPLFDLLKDYYYVCQRVGTVHKTDGKNVNMLWQTTDEIWERFDIDADTFPATNTSFQYIRKCPQTEKLYQTALDALSKGWGYGELNLQWGRSKAQPDELYMNIGLAITQTDIGNYQPIYFTQKNKGIKTQKQIYADHYFIGYWGDSGLNHKSVKDMYDKLMKKYSITIAKKFQEFKIHHLIKNKFLIREKRSA